MADARTGLIEKLWAAENRAEIAPPTAEGENCMAEIHLTGNARLAKPDDHSTTQYEPFISVSEIDDASYMDIVLPADFPEGPVEVVVRSMSEVGE